MGSQSKKIKIKKITASRVEIREVIKVIIIFRPFYLKWKRKEKNQQLLIQQSTSPEDGPSRTRVGASHEGFLFFFQIPVAATDDISDKEHICKAGRR